MLIQLKSFRAHHVRELYFQYLRNGEIKRWSDDRIDKGIIQYPILVTDSVDDICDKCRTYPAINFCKGPKVRKEDLEAAEILGISIGRRYTLEELIEIFEKKAREQDMDKGIQPDGWYYYINKFHQKPKK